MHDNSVRASFIKNFFCVLIFGIGIALFLWASKLVARHDYLITNVRFLKKDRITEEIVHVAIKRGVISYLGTNIVPAKAIILGDGLILTPGLIDVNSCGWLSHDAANLKLRDGITTFFNAHGDSFRANAKSIRASERLNYATSVGLIPAFARKLTREQMFAALEDSLRFGAYTVSLSPEYTKETTEDC